MWALAGAAFALFCVYLPWYLLLVIALVIVIILLVSWIATLRVWP